MKQIYAVAYYNPPIGNPTAHPSIVLTLGTVNTYLLQYRDGTSQKETIKSLQYAWYSVYHVFHSHPHYYRQVYGIPKITTLGNIRTHDHV